MNDFPLTFSITVIVRQQTKQSKANPTASYKRRGFKLRRATTLCMQG
jgi:hypothetical protein